jgi:SAM-dependent methyltransferase
MLAAMGWACRLARRLFRPLNYTLSMNAVTLPPWALSILRGPDAAEPVAFDNGRLVTRRGEELGRMESGVLRFPVRQSDAGIAFYRKVGGAHFYERSTVPFAMSALDTPVYHGHLYDVRPPDLDAVIIDVGGGDGRNARPWLEWGYRRVVVVDPAAEGLLRFRARIGDRRPEWLDRLLLIEADARALPFAAGCAQFVQAIESLCCLNENFELGFKDCVRVLADDGKVVLAERDYESALVIRLIYHGLEGMLETARAHMLWDGPNGSLRTRPFTEAELVDVATAFGLKVTSVVGTSLLSLLLGWLNGEGKLVGQEKHLPEVSALLTELGRSGAMRRSNIVIAEKGAAAR